MGTLAMALGQLGDVDAARGYATKALLRCERVGNPRGIAFNLANLGVAHLAAGEHQQAVDRYQRALAILDGSADAEIEAWTQHNLGKALSHLNDFPHAVRAFRRAIILNSSAGNRRWEAVILADLATTLVDAGHPTIARALRHTALETLREFTDPRAATIEAALASMGNP